MRPQAPVAASASGDGSNASSFTLFPCLNSYLSQQERKTLEEAVYAYRCGRYQDAENLFDALDSQGKKLPVLIERIEMLGKCNHYHDRARLLRRAIELVRYSKDLNHNEYSPNTRFDLLLKQLITLQLRHAELFKFGRLRALLVEARLMRDKLNKVADTEDLETIDVRCINYYYFALYHVKELSNWATAEYGSIFSRYEKEPWKEPFHLAVKLRQLGRLEESITLLHTALLVEVRKADKLMICDYIMEAATRMASSVNYVNRFKAATFLLQCGGHYVDINQFDHVSICINKAALILKRLFASDTDMREWQSADDQPDSIPIEDTILTNICTDWETIPPSLQSLLKTGFPRLHLDLRILHQRFLEKDHVHSNQLVAFSNEARQLSESAKQWWLLSMAYTAARSEHRNIHSRASLQNLANVELAYLTLACEVPRNILCWASSFPRHSGTSNSPSPSITLEHSTNFDEEYIKRHGFDIPIFLTSVYSAAANAAKELGLSREARNFKAKEALKWRECPQSSRDGDASPTAETENLHYRHQIHPYGLTTPFYQKVENCFMLMRRWAHEEIDAGTLNQGAWEDMFYHGTQYGRKGGKEAPSDHALRCAVFGELSQGLFKFQLSYHWSLWLEAIEPWLRLSEARRYVLKILVDMRSHAISYARQPNPGSTSVLAQYETAIEFAAAQKKRFDLYRDVLSDQASAADMIIARQGLIVANIGLACNQQARESGAITDEILRQGQESALVLRDECTLTIERSKMPTFQYNLLSTAASVCWQRYICYRSVSLDERFEIFEAMDEILADITRQKINTVASDFLKERGFNALALSANSSITGHYEQAITTALESLVTSIKACEQTGHPPAAALTELATSDARRHLRKCFERFISWVQRSKARTVTEMMGQGVVVPSHIMQSVSESAEAAGLLKLESELQDAVRTPNLMLQAQAQDKLDRCREQMRETPALELILNYRKSTYVSFDDIQALLSTFGPTVVLVDWLHCHWRNDFDIWIQCYRLGEWSQPHFVEGLKLSHVEAWWSGLTAFQKSFDGPGALEDLANIAALIEPLGVLTKPGETLVLCPTKILHRLPLHALTIEGKLLIERNPVSYCHSITQLKHCVQSLGEVEKPLHSALVIYPLDTQYKNSYEVRRSTAFVAELAHTLPTNAYFHQEPTSSSISKTSVIECFPNTDLLYWHGHVSFNAQAPMQSAFHLGDEDRTRDGSTDNRLTATELLDLRLERPALAVVMGCQSGVVSTGSADDLLGLSTSLYLAGATSIVSTLWKVEDDDAVQFASALFTALKEQVKLLTNEGVVGKGSRLCNVAAATREALLNIRISKDGIPRDPYHWAGFMTGGSWLCPAIDFRGTDSRVNNVQCDLGKE